MAKETVGQRFKSLGAKTLLWLLAISFIAGFLVVPSVGRFGAGGTRGDDTFAIINGEHKITVREFLETYRQMEFRYEEQYGEQWDQIKDYLLPQVKTNSIDRLVFRYGAGDQARELGLSVSDEEIRRLVHETPAFHDEKGVFRVNLYQQYLQRQRLSPEKFENDLREDLIRQKLTNLFYDGVRPSRAQVEKEWEDRNTKIALDFVSIGIEEIAGTMKPTDAQITAYYGQNQMEFFRPERRVIRYADFNPNGKQIRDRDNVKNIAEADLKAYYDGNAAEYTFNEENFRIREMVVAFDLGNPDDTAVKKLSDDEKKKQARELIEAAHERVVKKGEDFAAVANEVSTDRREKLLKRGGDIGVVSDKYFNKDIIERAKKLKLNEVSDIFESFNAYRFVVVTEKFAAGTRKPFDDQKDAIRRKLSNDRATAIAEAESAQYLEKVAKTGVPESSTEGGPEITVSAPFSRGESVAGLGRLTEPDEEAIFGTLKPGDAPKMARFGNRVIVYQLKEILPPAPSPMEEVREQIAERVKKQLAREKLSGEIDGLRKALLSGVPADRAAKSIKGAESGETGVFARNESGNAGNVSGVDVVNKIGRSGQLKLSAFMLKRPGDVAGPFEVDDRLVMVRLKSRLDPDPALREKQLEEVREDLFRKLRSEVQGQLLDKIKAETRLDLKVDVDKLLKRDEAEG